MTGRTFKVEPVGYEAALAQLRSVRETVFVQEQQVPLEEEWDALDPLCQHVVALDADGNAIGTGRLTPERKIGRMAVLAGWRGQGVGDAMLAALVAEARARSWAAVSLNAQVSAESFYARHGFIPTGGRFQEAGIEHQSMRRALQGPTAVENLAGAIAAVQGICSRARRSLCVYSRDLDPGLLDHPAVLEAMRRFSTSTRGGEVRILLQDAGTPQRSLAPLLPLSQRLPSVFAFREVSEPVDRAYASAFIANDQGGYYFRTLGHRFDGETDLEGMGRARQLREEFGRFWERSRPCAEFRSLGI